MITTQSCHSASESISSPFYLCGVLTASLRADPNWQLHWQVSFTYFLDRATWRHVKFLHDCLLTGSDTGSKSERIPRWLHKFHVRSDLSEKAQFHYEVERKNTVSLFICSAGLQAFYAAWWEVQESVKKRKQEREREMTFSLWNEESHNPQALEED